MERLTEAERILKYGIIPEDEEGLLAFSKQHKVSKHDTLTLLGKTILFFKIKTNKVKLSAW